MVENCMFVPSLTLPKGKISIKMQVDNVKYRIGFEVWRVCEKGKNGR